jgi:hypothetical protein
MLIYLNATNSKLDIKMGAGQKLSLCFIVTSFQL